MRTVLRADAIFDVLVGVLLLSATWDGLFAALDLPQAEPELWTNVAGGLLIAFGYLLWIAPREPHTTSAVAAAAAFANGLGALVLPLWLLFGDLDVGALGTTLLLLVTAILAFFAVAEGYLASRSVAILLPPD